jgi:hypothetical protein
VGIICSVFAFWQMVDAIYSKVVLHATVPGWAQTMTVLSFMFGVLFILLGVLGEYLGRVLVEVRNRPRFLVSEFIGIDNRSLNHPVPRTDQIIQDSTIIDQMKFKTEMKQL